MIRIKKVAANEPQSWKDYKTTPGADYAPSDDLRKALCDEQGHICAFCMRRIPTAKRDPNEAEYSKIAHLISRQNADSKKFDYDNMVLCCPGNIDGSSHCDKSQGNANITLPLFDEHLQQSIRYRTFDGEIASSNRGWDDEINKVLCLNNVLLKRNRVEALDGIRIILERVRWTETQLQKKLDEWSTFDAEGKLKPFCGIVIWYLERKIKQLKCT